MQKKLTLRLDENLIDSAKIFATKKGKSLSGIVADYFQILTKEKTSNKQELPPNVKALYGALEDVQIDEEDYKKHLEEKYL